MQKKVLSLFLCICIFIMMMPTVVFGETKEVLTTSNKIIYTDVSVGSSSEQDGSLEKPYYDIADAIYAAKDGDTIVIKSSGGYVNDLTSGDLGQNAPLIIDKRVTIQGEGDSMPSLNMRRGGIILAEDVTFRNFNFNYTNSIGAVFANGHSLVMENIGCIRGTELIDIFGGSLSGQTVDYGDKSKIIVTGTKTNIGDIFAGSQDKDWTQDVDITVEGRVGNIGSIYAAGKSSSSSGEVTINLKNSNVKNVDGKQGESILKNAVVSVSVEGTNDLMSFQNVGILELMKGKLKPKVLNEDIEIKIHSGSSLDLSSVTKTNPSFKIRKLNGDEGSILYTDQDASLNINESFTGMIEFRTVNEASLMQEESGLVRLDHVYIYVENAPEKQGVFTFIPYFTQKDEVVLSDMDGKWTAVPIKEKEATESAIDVTVSTEEDESLYEKNDKLKYPSNSRTFKTQQIISKSDENTVNGYENLREVLKEQILPQSVNTLIKTFPITFQYLDNSDIGIGLNLYSGSWLPDNNLLASTVGYVTLSTVFEEVNDRVVMDLYYTLAVNYDMLSFSNNDIGELTPDGRKYLESTISHEMMHAMMYEALTSGMLGVSEDNPRSHKAKMFPSWFIEGTAQAAGGGANIVRRTLDITADSEESDIKSKLQRYHLNKGNTYADYGTGYLATMYLGYLMNGEDSIKKEDISNGLDKFLNEIRGGKSLNRAIVDNTKYLSISDFENNFANDAARFTKRLMVDIGNDGLGALMGGSYQDTDILDDKAINTNVFNLNSQYNRVLNIYPKDYVVMAGGQKETDGVAGPRYSNVEDDLSHVEEESLLNVDENTTIGQEIGLGGSLSEDSTLGLDGSNVEDDLSHVEEESLLNVDENTTIGQEIGLGGSLSEDSTLGLDGSNVEDDLSHVEEESLLNVDENTTIGQEIGLGGSLSEDSTLGLDGSNVEDDLSHVEEESLLNSDENTTIGQEIGLGDSLSEDSTSGSDDPNVEDDLPHVETSPMNKGRLPNVDGNTMIWQEISSGDSLSEDFTSGSNDSNVAPEDLNWDGTYADENNSGGGTSTDSSSSDNTIITVTPHPTENGNNPVVDTIIRITDKNIKDSYNEALVESKRSNKKVNGITLVLNKNTGNKILNSVTVNLPQSVQDFIISKKNIYAIEVAYNPNIKIKMDLATIKEINKQAKADVNVTITKLDSNKLAGNAKTAIGSRPVFELKVNYGSGKQVSNFGTGNVMLEIPYTLGSNEKAGNVHAVYVDTNGKIEWLTNSVYDCVSKVLRFTTSHFSTYGVGYKTINTNFTDITNHWAKENIEFIVARGLFNGTTTTTFMPKTAMKRGMFVTALGRLAKVDVSKYTKSRFYDVKDDAYYMGYVEWATENKIINGIGDCKFAPEQPITREQMTVIIKNYAKAIGFNLPKSYKAFTFVDNVKINPYAKDAVKQMQMAGVISGKNGDKFFPQGIATRAEVATVLKRFVELMIDRDFTQD